MDTTLCTSPDGASGAVARIVYASRAAVHEGVYAQMERIRASAVRHNVPLGISTALLAQSGWFVQWKEGPGPELRQLMGRVAEDPRHHSLRIVHASRGPRLLHGPWSMAFVQCGEPQADFADRVAALQGWRERGCQESPPTVWRQLSTPLGHPGAERQGDPDAFQRVLACSSRGVDAFDLVRWVARSECIEVVHRRVAGAHDLDVATDYVDLAHGRGVQRVIAMARRGLEFPLTRAFLADYSHAVLLLCGDLEADLLLVRRIVRACAGASASPLLLGVGGPEALQGPLAELAGHAGLAWQPVQAGPQPQERWEALQAVLHGRREQVQMERAPQLAPAAPREQVQVARAPQLAQAAPC